MALLYTWNWIIKLNYILPAARIMKAHKMMKPKCYKKHSIISGSNISIPSYRKEVNILHNCTCKLHWPVCAVSDFTGNLKIIYQLLKLCSTEYCVLWWLWLVNRKDGRIIYIIILTPSKIEATINNQTPPITHPITSSVPPIPNTKAFFAFTDSAMAATVLHTGINPENKFTYLYNTFKLKCVCKNKY